MNQAAWQFADGLYTYWRYDPAGRWTTVSNSVSTDSTEFDLAGRATRTVTTRGSTVYTQVPTYVDGQLRRLDVSGPWAGLRSVSYAHQADKRLYSITDFFGAVTTLGYNADGALTVRNAPGTNLFTDNGSTHTPTEKNGIAYSYTPRGQVDKVRVIDDPAYRQFEYDALGRLRSLERSAIPRTSSA